MPIPNNNCIIFEQEFEFRIEIDMNVLCKMNSNAEIENKDMKEAIFCNIFDKENTILKVTVICKMSCKSINYNLVKVGNMHLLCKFTPCNNDFIFNACSSYIMQCIQIFFYILSNITL